VRTSVVAVVFFGLLCVFAAYTVVYSQNMPSQSQSTVTVASYLASGSYVYAANLTPDALYHTTVLGNGNSTLFVSITKSINVTFNGVVSSTGQASIVLTPSYRVTLSGGPWNKTLDQSTGLPPISGISSVTVMKSFSLNVTQILTLANEIGNELHYASPTYLVQVVSMVNGTLDATGHTSSFGIAAPLDLTVSNGVIALNGTSFQQRGSISNGVLVTNGDVPQLREFAFVFLAGSLACTAVAGVFVARKGEPGTGAENLEKMITPYSEIIAKIQSLPAGGRQIVVDKWEDLVKVSDTLGKPILEFVERSKSGDAQHSFAVLDGDAVYVFQAVASTASSESRET